MKPPTRPKILILTGLLLFLISFLLPAYSVNSKLFYGYQCAYIAPAVAISGSLDGGIIMKFLIRGHYVILGLHNVILPVYILLTEKYFGGKYNWVLYFLVITTMNTIGFFFYTHFNSSRDDVLYIGYYVWVVSSVMILIPLMYQKQIQ